MWAQFAKTISEGILCAFSFYLDLVFNFDLFLNDIQLLR